MAAEGRRGAGGRCARGRSHVSRTAFTGGRLEQPASVASLFVGHSIVTVARSDAFLVLGESSRVPLAAWVTHSRSETCAELHRDTFEGAASGGIISSGDRWGGHEEGARAKASGHPNLVFQSVSTTSAGSRCREGRTMFGGVPAGSLIGPRSRPGVGSIARGFLHAAVAAGACGAVGRGK
jgi:hypothetical protein